MTFKVKTKGQIEGEKLLVPKLRFKEFNNQWNTYKLEELVIFLDGQRKPIKDSDRNKFRGVYPYYGASGIIDYVKDYIFDKDTILLSEDGANILTRSTRLAFIASGKYWVNNHAHVLEPKNTNIYFLCELLESLNYEQYNTGTAQPKLNQEICKNIELTVPDIMEQSKIGNFLSLLDKKIELQKKKIEALKIYKKGLVQKLINSNNCEEKRISEFGTIITGTTPSKLIQSYWHNGTIVWVTPSDITESKDIYNSHDMLTPDGLKAGRFVPAGSILITCIASIGKNAILKVDGSCNQQINAIIPNKNFNADYLYYLFELKKDYLQSTAGTSATSIINKTSFEKLVFKIHNIEQQNEYSKILNCLESKIETEKHKFKKLTLLKKSLLQQMFI